MDGFIADASGIPMFPETAWADWCALTNAAGGVVAGRASVEQIEQEGMAEGLTLRHKLVLTSRDAEVAEGWDRVASPAEALAVLDQAGVSEAIVGGGRSVYHAFMRAGLVDEVVLDLQPVVFGTGVPVFGDRLDLTALKLVSSTPLNDDALRLRYLVVRADG